MPKLIGQEITCLAPGSESLEEEGRVLLPVCARVPPVAVCADGCSQSDLTTSSYELSCSKSDISFWF